MRRAVARRHGNLRAAPGFAAGLCWSFWSHAGRITAGEITVQTFTHASAPSREPAYSAMPRGPREGECCCSKLVISISIEDDRLVSASPRRCSRLDRSSVCPAEPRSPSEPETCRALELTKPQAQLPTYLPCRGPVTPRHEPTRFLIDNISRFQSNKRRPAGSLQSFGELVLCTHCPGDRDSGCASSQFMVR